MILIKTSIIIIIIIMMLRAMPECGQMLFRRRNRKQLKKTHLAKIGKW